MTDENMRRAAVESPVHGLALANEIRRLHEKHDEEMHEALMRAVFPHGTLERLAALEQNHAGLTIYYEHAKAANERLIGKLEEKCREVAILQVAQSSSYYTGLRDGLRKFAWWKDGVQYVGSCGTTLVAALSHIDAEEKSRVRVVDRAQVT